MVYCTKITPTLTRETLFSKSSFWHIHILCGLAFATVELYKFCEIHFHEDAWNFQNSYNYLALKFKKES